MPLTHLRPNLWFTSGSPQLSWDLISGLFISLHRVTFTHWNKEEATVKHSKLAYPFSLLYTQGVTVSGYSNA